RLKHRPEVELGGGADEADDAALVLHARQLDDDRVALAADVGLGHAEGVDPGPDDRDRLVQHAALDLALGLEHDGPAALEVDAEQRRISGRDGGAQRDHRDADDAEQLYPQRAAHYAASLIWLTHLAHSFGSLIWHLVLGGVGVLDVGLVVKGVVINGVVIDGHDLFDPPVHGHTHHPQHH